MNTLLLRLSGPMQSWGVQSRFGMRETGLEPSKSGIIGLLCAALGRPRSAPLEDLTALDMGVRVDREGLLSRDYHTAGKGGYYKGSGKLETKNLIVSTRYYLAQAVFLVGLAGEAELLQTLHRALRDPVWPLYLGRKAFVPSEPVWLEDGYKLEMSLMQALGTYPWLCQTGSIPERMRLVFDDPYGDEMRQDLPLSFEDRRFVSRNVRVFFGPPPTSN